MPEIIEPTFFDTRNYQIPEASVPPGLDPFEDASEPVLRWADSVRARLKAKREAKEGRQLGDRAPDSLPVIETSPSLSTDESLPVIEAIQALPAIETSPSLPSSESLPVIEDGQGVIGQAIPEKSRQKNSGCIGTYKKGKLEYYRYSYRVNGKLKHKHIGSVTCKNARHTVAIIRRYILCELPSRWILYNFFDGPSYEGSDDDFLRCYQRLHSFPYELPPLPKPPDSYPDPAIHSIEEL